MSAIEEANLAFVERFVKKQSYAILPGAIIMTTSGKELALYKEPTSDQKLREFEDNFAIVAQAMGLPHEEDNVLFVTIE